MSLRRSFSLSRKKKPEAKPKVTNISSDLAMKIIEKELELEKSWNATVIHELMALYSQAIEYYEQQGNPKYYDFQDRMHKMLVKPQVIAVLQRINCSESDPRPSLAAQIDEEKLKIVKEIDFFSNVPEEKPLSPSTEKSPDKSLEIPQEITPMYIRKEQAEITRKQLSKELHKNLSRPKPLRNFGIMIDRHSSSSKETALKAAADFKSQDFALERRLAGRKSAQVNRSLNFLSMSSGDLSQVFHCDFSDEEHNNSSTKSSFFTTDDQVTENYEKFEKRLEEIMENNFSERAAKVAEIKFRYESQINEISGMGDIMDLLVKQMKTNMQEEIESTVVEYDLKRREEIKKLKLEISC